MASKDRKADSARTPLPPPELAAVPVPDPPARLIATPRLHPEFEALLRSRKECTRRFGQMVRAVRLRRGLSQLELSFRAKVHRSHVSLIEQARRHARIDTICALAAGLQVSPAELMPTPAPPRPPES